MSAARGVKIKVLRAVYRIKEEIKVENPQLERRASFLRSVRVSFAAEEMISR